MMVNEEQARSTTGIQRGWDKRVGIVAKEEEKAKRMAEANIKRL